MLVSYAQMSRTFFCFAGLNGEDVHSHLDRLVTCFIGLVTLLHDSFCERTLLATHTGLTRQKVLGAHCDELVDNAEHAHVGWARVGLDRDYVPMLLRQFIVRDLVLLEGCDGDIQMLVDVCNSVMMVGREFIEFEGHTFGLGLGRIEKVRVVSQEEDLQVLLWQFIDLAYQGFGTGDHVGNWVKTLHAPVDGDERAHLLCDLVGERMPALMVRQRLVHLGVLNVAKATVVKQANHVSLGGKEVHECPGVVALASAKLLWVLQYKASTLRRKVEKMMEAVVGLVQEMKVGIDLNVRVFGGGSGASLASLSNPVTKVLHGDVRKEAFVLLKPSVIVVKVKRETATGAQMRAVHVR